MVKAAIPIPSAKTVPVAANRANTKKKTKPVKKIAAKAKTVKKELDHIPTLVSMSDDMIYLTV